MKKPSLSHIVSRAFTRNLASLTLGPLAVTLGVFATVACGGNVDTGGKQGDLTKNGTGGTSAADAGPGDPVGACDDYFAKVVHPCGLEGVSTALSMSELAHVKELYGTSCTSRLAAPGTGFTAGAVEACVSAVTSQGCSATGSEPCLFLGGTLPGGAPCFKGEQCEAGVCTTPVQMGFAAPSCGTCAPPGPRQCATSTGPMGPGGTLGTFNPGACRTDEVCDTMNTQLCVPRGDKVGASCVSASAGPQLPGCMPGLYCDETTLKCVADHVVGKGAACGGSSTCAPSLVCPMGEPLRNRPGSGPTPPPPATCQDPLTAGTPCSADSDCASGLGCLGNCSNAAVQCTCAAVTFAGPGEPCDSQTRCRLGYCPGNGARCPAVIPDGQPCTLNSPLGPPGTQETCEQFSSCINGTCKPGYPTCQ